MRRPGPAYPGLIVSSLNQEHGIGAIRAGSGERLPDLRIGDTVTILPIHACATAAQLDACHGQGSGLARNPAWPRFRGW